MFANIRYYIKYCSFGFIEFYWFNEHNVWLIIIIGQRGKKTKEKDLSLIGIVIDFKHKSNNERKGKHISNYFWFLSFAFYKEREKGQKSI